MRKLRALDQRLPTGSRREPKVILPEKIRVKAPLTVSKDGGEIDAITASTITSRAFLLAVNNAYAAYKNQHVDGASGATQQEQPAEEAVSDTTNVEPVK